MERALTDFGAEESFGQAAVRVQEHYGWEVGRTTILRVVEGRASEAEKFVKDRLDAAESKYNKDNSNFPGTSQMLVEMDGCEIRTGYLVAAKGRGRTPVRKHRRRRRVEAWRDVRVGLAGPLNAPDERTYVARVDTYPQVVRQLFAAACDQGMSDQTQSIAVADGGNGLREELDAQFVGGQFILDRPHLKQHFYQAADAQGLKDELRHSWVADHFKEIDAGNARKVIKKLREHKGQGKKRIKVVVATFSRGFAAELAFFGPR